MKVPGNLCIFEAKSPPSTTNQSQPPIATLSCKLHHRGIGPNMTAWFDLSRHCKATNPYDFAGCLEDSFSLYDTIRFDFASFALGGSPSTFFGVLAWTAFAGHLDTAFFAFNPAVAFFTFPTCAGEVFAMDTILP
ncbi:hypothetical protein ECG_06144 [Echinococcus granulosus]|uniref:Uncharacterized protein n=1 Tax=Echinococcus granulosus TaxID=6210 RepID=U6FT74_ECHGR|nr:hypothetical protein ECG_06144 [Echinococcus granulosus]CDI70129.1 hypothetical protein EgrG_002061400 [Echinococcus granulosus]